MFHKLFAAFLISALIMGCSAKSPDGESNIGERGPQNMPEGDH
jgi:hypothetical protein